MQKEFSIDDKPSQLHGDVCCEADQCQRVVGTHRVVWYCLAASLRLAPRRQTIYLVPNIVQLAGTSGSLVI